MTPDQKQRAMQGIVDQIEALRTQRRAAMAEEAGMLANYTKAQQKTADLGAEMALQEEILKAIEGIEPGADAASSSAETAKPPRTPAK